MLQHPMIWRTPRTARRRKKAKAEAAETAKRAAEGLRSSAPAVCALVRSLNETVEPFYEVAAAGLRSSGEKFKNALPEEGGDLAV